MKAQFTDSSRNEVYVFFKDYKFIIPFAEVKEIHQSLSELINERSLIDESVRNKEAAISRSFNMAKNKMSVQKLKDGE